MRVVQLVAVLAIVLVTACAPGSGAPAPTPPDANRPDASPSDASPSAQALAGELTVFGAASLTDAFERIGAAFVEEHPDVRVIHNFAGSQQLATQILQGAPADVFASADAAQIDTLVEAGRAHRLRTFTRNTLAIVVEPANPQGVEGLEDLARQDLRVVLAAEEVPAGRHARHALDAAGVTIEPVSLETDVRAVLAKVRLGEADAGIVYESDVVAAGRDVASVPIAAADNVAAAYPVSVLTDAPNARAGQAFVDFLGGAQAQQVLTELGFTAP